MEIFNSIVTILVPVIFVGVAIYIVVVLIGRRTLAKQEAPHVKQVVSVVPGADSSIGVGETIIVVRNGKEL